LIDFHIDKTNDDDKYLRNKVRNNLIPQLQNDFNPQIIDVLANTAMTISEDMGTLRGFCQRFWKCDTFNVITFSASDLIKQNVSLQRLSLRLMIEELLGDTDNVEKGFVDEMRKMISSTKSKEQKMQGKDLKMVKKGDRVELACLQKKNKENNVV
jgi:tRNA(Ile)-lysidine synthase